MKKKYYDVSQDGLIVNLNKQAFEKEGKAKAKLLEKAKSLAEGVFIDLRIRVYTTLNLCSFYVKENSEFLALKILTDEIKFFASKTEFLWENALLYLMSGSIKFEIQVYEEALNDILKAIELLLIIKQKDINYYTVLATCYYNCGLAYGKLYKLPQSLKYSKKAQKLALLKLGPANIITGFMRKNKPLSKNIQKPVFNIDQPRYITGERLRPMNKLSESSAKIDHFSQNSKKLFKKFKKLSNSSDLKDIISEKPKNYQFPMLIYKEFKKNTHESQQFEKNLLELENQISLNIKKKIGMLAPIKEFSNDQTSLQKKHSKSNKDSLNSLPSQSFLMICKLQANIRRFLAQKRYQKILRSVILIQKNVKRFQVKSIYKHIRAAVIFIQAVFRGYFIRKKMKVR